MTTLARFIVLGSLLVVLSGCSTYAASRYANSAETVQALRAHRGQITVAVGPFTATEANKREITCRAVGPIKTPDGETFEEFVRKALIAELTLAELYAAAAPITLTGHLHPIDFSSGITDAVWTLRLDVASSNGAKLSVAEDYTFTSSWYGGTACNQTAQALMPAVQNLVAKVVRHPEFARLLGLAR